MGVTRVLVVGFKSTPYRSRRIMEELASRGIQADYVHLDDFIFVTKDNTYKVICEEKTVDFSRYSHAMLLYTIGATKGAFNIIYTLLKVNGVTILNEQRFNSPLQLVPKELQKLLFSLAGLPTADSSYSLKRTIPTKKLLEPISSEEIVMKPTYGSEGKGLQFFKSHDEAAIYVDEHGIQRELRNFLFERAVHIQCDYRVFVIGDRVVASMQRNIVPGKKVSNFSQGGKTELVDLPPVAHEIAIKATKALLADYAGVDLLYDSIHNEYQVIEVNLFPQFKGVEAITGKNVAGMLIDYLFKRDISPLVSV